MMYYTVSRTIQCDLKTYTFYSKATKPKIIVIADKTTELPSEDG